MDPPARFSFDRGTPTESEKVNYDKNGRVVNSTFQSEGVDDEFYKPIPKYEGMHRYDPSFTWEPQEEKKVVRKVRSFPQTQRNHPNAFIDR